MTDYIADYRTWLQEEKHASDNTLSSYLRDINQFKTWLLGAGSPDLRRVKKDTINEYMLYLSGAGSRPRPSRAARPRSSRFTPICSGAARSKRTRPRTSPR